MTQEPIVRFAKRMDQLPPYLFGMINKMKMEKRWQGHDVIDLGMGNPIDPAPQAVVSKLCEVAQDPKSHRYPMAGGMKNLRREIAQFYLNDYAIDLDPDTQVICTIGSKEGVSHLCLALVGSGDTVLVPAPAFPIHVYAAVIAGASVIRIPLAEENAFLERIAFLCESLTPRPKLLMLNYPHNPTGTLASREFFSQVVTMARKYRLMVVNDFAYGKITFDGQKACSFMEIPGSMEVGVEFGSFSKSFNMAGWRLGYCVGNPEILSGLSKIKGYYDYGIFNAIQTAGIIALRDCADDVGQQAAAYQDRRDVLCDGLERMGWPVKKPAAGMFVWVKIPPPYEKMGSVPFAVEMMQRAHVAVAPGAGFGQEGEGYLRLALVENEHRIRQALRQMRRALIEIDEQQDAD